LSAACAAPQGVRSTLRSSGSGLSAGSPSRAPNRPSWGFAGLQRISAVSSALLASGAPGHPFRRRAGVPRCTAGPQALACDLASRSLARPSRARPENRRRPEDRRHPPGLSAPTALPEPRVRSSRALPLPATFRPRRFARPRRFTPRDPFRVCFAPVTLLGFRLQGLAPPREVRASLEAGALLPFGRPSPDRLSADRRATRDFRAFVFPERPYREDRNPARPLPS